MIKPAEKRQNLQQCPVSQMLSEQMTAFNAPWWRLVKLPSIKNPTPTIAQAEKTQSTQIVANQTKSVNGLDQISHYKQPECDTHILIRLGKLHWPFMDICGWSLGKSRDFFFTRAYLKKTVFYKVKVVCKIGVCTLLLGIPHQVKN